MAKTDKCGPTLIWSAAAIEWHEKLLDQLLTEDYVPPDILWCQKRTAQDDDTPQKIRRKIGAVLRRFNAETGELAQMPARRSKKKRR